MRHRIHGKQLNRTSEHRRAMLRNLAAGLFEHGQIETTMPKAKAVQPFVEKIITTAKQGTLHARRRIESQINDRRIHSWVADENVPESRKTNPWFDLPPEDAIEFNRYGELRKAPRLVQHIMHTVAPLFADRDGGYTRIIKTGRHRLGDGTDLVILQLVGREEGPDIGGGVSPRREKAGRRETFAASLAVTAPCVSDEDIVEDDAVPAEAPDMETDIEVDVEGVMEDEAGLEVEEPSKEADTESPSPGEDTGDADADIPPEDAAAPSAEDEPVPGEAGSAAATVEEGSDEDADGDAEEDTAAEDAGEESGGEGSPDDDPEAKPEDG